MAISKKSWSIGGALLLSVVMVSGAFILSSPNFGSNVASALGSDALLRAYASRDTDHDGLFDWEETLYKTDPQNAYSFSKEVTDGEALKQGLIKPKFASEKKADDPSKLSKFDTSRIPAKVPAKGTLTDEFGQMFISEYLSNTSGEPLTEEQRQAIVDKLLVLFTERAKVLVSSKYTTADVHTDPTVAVSEYVAFTHAVFSSEDLTNTGGTILSLAEELMIKEHGDAEEKLLAISKISERFVKKFLLVTAPPELANSHALFIRSFDAKSHIAKLLAKYQDDPIASLGALAEFERTSQDLLDAFTGIATEILKTGEPLAGTNEAIIVNIARAQKLNE